MQTGLGLESTYNALQVYVLYDSWRVVNGGISSHEQGQDPQLKQTHFAEGYAVVALVDAGEGMVAPEDSGCNHAVGEASSYLLSSIFSALHSLVVVNQPYTSKDEYVEDGVEMTKCK